MKKLFVITLLFSFLSTFAQNNKELNLSPVSNKIQYGILFDVNVSNPSLPATDAPPFANLERIESRLGAGFSLGILSQYQISSFLAARIQGILSFQEHRLAYQFKNEPDVVRTRELVKVDFPIHVVFEKEKDEITPSAIIGGRYSYDVSNDSDLTTSLFNFRSHDFQLDLGFGVKFPFKHFNFKPEFIYSRGFLTQVAQSTDQPFTDYLNNQFSLRFVFYK